MAEKRSMVRRQVVAIMKKRKLTVNAVAGGMKKRESAVRAWLYGQREDAKISTLEAVMKVMGLKVKIVEKEKRKASK